jgi:Asp-tRNA(Asn)/Glu-tRNA(Gln) amidotransferase A subunit family amidase
MTAKQINKDEILTMDATGIAALIKEEKISVFNTVSTFIDHIKKVNPSLNAMVESRFSEALKEAEEKDEILQKERPRAPLFGVPITIKEAFDVASMKTTGGLVHRHDLISRTDAEAVARLKEAGAIVLGKTNTSALCYCQETDNKLYGRTNNPWDMERTAGGSSGGEGALLAAGGAAAGLGSDIGGSIRFPAHFNGVLGFKPGMGRVSLKGHFPQAATTLQQRMMGAGPMGKSVRDIELLYHLLSAEKSMVSTLHTFKIDILPPNVNYPLSEKTKETLNEIVDFLTNSFLTGRFLPPYFEDSALLWQEIMSSDGGKQIEKEAFNHDRSRVWKAYTKERLTKKTDVHPYLAWAIIGTKLFKPSKSRLREIQRILAEGDSELKDYLDRRIVIFPVYHTGALKHGKLFEEIFSIRKTFLQFMPYVAYANVWGLPSLTIPVGRDENNMPIGVQLISRTGNEDALFRLGKMLERKFSGYQRAEMDVNGD